MANHKIHKFPKSRIATIDVCEVGKQKHHVIAMIELDVSGSREKIKQYNKGKKYKISFTAWLIHVIGHTIKNHETASSYLKGKRNVVIFNDVNVSMVVEKEIDGQKVPIPLIIEKANERSIESIGLQISNAKSDELSDNDIVLQKQTSQMEKLYYHFPGFVRRYVWRWMLRRPGFVFNKMGNVAFTSLGMMGKVDGWFIPISVHPICFGVGAIIKKPVVLDNIIEIREMLKMTILLDHDVMDGAPMARFIRELSKNIKGGFGM